MAIKGLTTPVFADYTFNGSEVVYQNGFVCGSAIEYGVEVETSDNNPLYGDDRIIENDYGTFNTGTLTLNTSDLTQIDSKRLLGLKEVQVEVGEASVTELVTDDDAKATPKGFGIIEAHQINDVDKYRAVILCKVAMGIPAEAATTKGESIEWQTKEIEGTISRADQSSGNYKHAWKREAWFDTHDEAMAYLRTVLNALDTVNATSQEEQTQGRRSSRLQTRELVHTSTALRDRCLPTSRILPHGQIFLRAEKSQRQTAQHCTLHRWTLRRKQSARER